MHIKHLPTAILNIPFYKARTLLGVICVCMLHCINPKMYSSDIAECDIVFHLPPVVNIIKKNCLFSRWDRATSLNQAQCNYMYLTSFRNKALINQ